MKSPESERRKKRSLTSTLDFFFPQTPVSNASDPFREIDKGSSKLKPIILKSRCSPIMFEKKLSIRIPELTKNGKIKSNKKFLPALSPRPGISRKSPEAKKPQVSLKFTEKVCQSYQVDLIQLEESGQLEVSFGKKGTCLEQGNPFNIGS